MAAYLSVGAVWTTGECVFWMPLTCGTNTELAMFVFHPLQVSHLMTLMQLIVNLCLLATEALFGPLGSATACVRTLASPAQASRGWPAPAPLHPSFHTLPAACSTSSPSLCPTRKQPGYCLNVLLCQKDSAHTVANRTFSIAEDQALFSSYAHRASDWSQGGLQLVRTLCVCQRTSPPSTVSCSVPYVGLLAC